MKEHYHNLNEKFNPVNGKELFRLDETTTKVEAKPALTLGAFVQSLITAGRTERIKNPSKNYQKYINLLHKLELEGVIINKPLSEICNRDFIDFGIFILYKLTKKEGQGNYLNVMKLFKAVHNIAVSRELNEHNLRYPYKKEQGAFCVQSKTIQPICAV